MFDPLVLARHQPVHALFGPALELQQLGRSFRRHEAALGTSFSVLFEVERPLLDDVTVEALRALGPRLCTVRYRPTGLRVRAEFLPTVDGGVCLWGSAIVSSNDELRRLGLDLGDFASHDATLDLLNALTLSRATIEDFRALAERQRQQQLELERARDEAERASSVKTRFLNTMSHELRTPLHAITGFARLLGDAPLLAHHQQFLEGITGSAELLVAMIGQVLDLAKIEAGRLELSHDVVALDQLLTQVVRTVEPRVAEKGLRFEFERVGGDGVWVQTDALRVQQIALNLLSNAVKFTDHGRVRAAARWADDVFSLAVEDEGPGLSAEEIDQLFKPFTQLRHDRGGTGLGLAISREFAQLLGGRLSVKSRRGEGSTFTLEVPAPQVRAPPTTETRARARVARSVLLVDDNPLNRVIGQRLLERLGHAVEVASGGEEALGRMAARRFDVVVTDLLMPEIDGFELARRVRARGDATPLIALTANASSDGREACLAVGMNDYLTKPLDLDLLEAAFSRLA